MPSYKMETSKAALAAKRSGFTRGSVGVADALDGSLLFLARGAGPPLSSVLGRDQKAHASHTNTHGHTSHLPPSLSATVRIYAVIKASEDPQTPAQVSVRGLRPYSAGDLTMHADGHVSLDVAKGSEF